MADHVQLSNVRLWYDEQGSGAPLVLIHGGVVDARFFAANVPALAEHFRVYAIDLRGHGHTADVEGPLTYDALSGDTIEFIEAVVGGRAHVVGHSVGATTALFTALRRPDLVDRLVMISGGFDHTAELGADQEPDVDAVVAFLGAAYGEVSPDGEAHFPEMVRKIFAMSAREPDLQASDVAVIPNRTLVVAADDDIITLEHTIELYRAIPNSELAIIPGTSHFLPQEKPAAVNRVLIDFLGTDPVQTVAPVRRAGG